MLEERLHLRAPHPLDPAVPYQAVGGGQRTALPGMPPITARYHEHAFMLCVEGQGQVDIDDVTHLANSGDIVWLKTAGRYAHGCAPGAPGWAYLWVGVASGTGLDAAHEMGGAARDPVFAADLGAEIRPVFDDTIAAIRSPSPVAPALISAGIAAILAEALLRRSRRDGLIVADPEGGRLGALLDRMRAEVDRRWTIPDMAGLAALSPSQLHRVFRKQFGVSPISWLRHERINRASRLLADHALSVAEVGRRCGYADPYHFSRDFRRLNGRSPTGFRAEHGG